MNVRVSGACPPGKVMRCFDFPARFSSVPNDPTQILTNNPNKG